MLIIIGWILSWRGPRRRRWIVLAAGAVVSVFCLAVGIAIIRTTPYVLASGVAGLVWTILLALVTLIVHLILRLRH